MLLTPAQMKPRQSESRRNSFFYPGWMRLMFTCVLGRWVASTVWQSLEEGAGKRCSECDMHEHTHTHTHTKMASGSFLSTLKPVSAFWTCTWCRTAVTQYGTDFPLVFYIIIVYKCKSSKSLTLNSSALADFLSDSPCTSFTSSALCCHRDGLDLALLVDTGSFPVTADLTSFGYTTKKSLTLHSLRQCHICWLHHQEVIDATLLAPTSHLGSVHF